VLLAAASIMIAAMTLKNVMGAIAVAIALFSYALYVWQTLRGQTRPHPLSWLIFGTLSGTGYLVQLDEAAGPASWVMGITAVVCLLLCLMSFWRGERAFPWYEWAFLAAAAVIFVFYLVSRQPTVAAVLATTVNVLGFGPTVTKAWARPHSDSVTTFALNSIKWLPAFFAFDSVSIASWVMPVALVVANAAVALLILWRRLQA
jgi:hypothetical protein